MKYLISKQVKHTANPIMNEKGNTRIHIESRTYIWIGVFHQPDLWSQIYKGNFLSPKQPKKGDGEEGKKVGPHL